MNSLEDDDYWNESKSKKFDFDKDDNESDNAILLEEAIDKSNFNNCVKDYFPANRTFEFDSISKYLSQQCIHCILTSENIKLDESTASSNFSHDDEVRILKRRLHEKSAPTNEQDTIDNILLEKPFNLESFRSFSKKKNLLTCAVKSRDGNAILTVLVYLSKTLKAALLYQLLNDNPVAASHFIHYLYARRKMLELGDVLEILGRSKENSMKHLAVASQNPHRLQQRLRLLLKNPSLEPWDHQMIENYSKLVEWQISAAKATNDHSIIGESAVQTSKFSFIHKLTIPFPGDISKSELQPNYLAKCLEIPHKLSFMATVRANAELKQWESIEQLLTIKGWVGGRKLSTNLPIDKLLDELYRSGASDSLLDNILAILEIDKRIEIARKLERHAIVIEAYGKKKDRGALLQYMSSLDNRSAEYIHAENVLQTMMMKKRS